MADRLFGITDAGRVRENNEDEFITQEVMQNKFMIAGVIDGVGGYAGGEIAAALTKEVILRELETIEPDPISQLSRVFYLANEQIATHKQGDLELMDMACVATLAVIDRQNNLLHYVHVGDTRLYLFRDHSLVKISHDQSFVGFLEDSGRLTEEAAMQHPKRNQINQALGLTSREGMTDAYFETGSSPFLPDDLILLCSDGLTDMVDAALITAVLNGPETLAIKGARLVEEANLAGGKDNVTVVLAKNDKVRASYEFSKSEPVKRAVAPEPFSAAEPSAVPLKKAANPLPEENRVQQKRGKGLIFLLSALCLLFLGTTIWLFLYHTAEGTKLEQPGTVLVTPIKPGLNPQEKKIGDMLLSLKGDTLLLSDTVFKVPVRLSQALMVDRDTLILKTKGNIVFQSDPAYKGPALILSPKCKYVKIDQLVLENFETGVVCYNNTLDLKNIRFNKVNYPLEVRFVFPDQYYVNGRLSKRNYAADSLAKK
ncbi:PP2C family protein-serine/threonine phosphatase [Pedobacter cryoconitis]|uniref:Serine/threonine protein phosphatase PrpC n=1 Tax=Pedobacter cryoconitis TaxID=188932 RepID=A0A327T2U8_9SPHI|nr:protein phosphatase 2C domain-containing protein [Pedobacter cryoconitis]RAJ35589.1 serine/threonine protein phosphatase PrpC [Pedobacter cryoconitis]